MIKLFNRLQYNFSPADPTIIFEYSEDVRESMNSLSSFLPEWGYEDLRNSDVSGYLVNPVAEITQLIISTCQDIYLTANSVANSEANILSDVANTAKLCENTCGTFYSHTNRLSGLVEVTTDTIHLPHYDTAIAIGKAITHLVQQSDGYSNSSTILGSFTSILVEDELTIYYDTIKEYPNTINNSIDVGETSNLDSNIANTMIYNIQAITDFMNYRKYHDENFYSQSRLVVEDYDKLKRYIDNGQTETYLIENFLQSDKLKERL